MLRAVGGMPKHVDPRDEHLTPIFGVTRAPDVADDEILVPSQKRAMSLDRHLLPPKKRSALSVVSK